MKGVAAHDLADRSIVSGRDEIVRLFRRNRQSSNAESGWYRRRTLAAPISMSWQVPPLGTKLRWTNCCRYKDRTDLPYLTISACQCSEGIFPHHPLSHSNSIRWLLSSRNVQQLQMSLYEVWEAASGSPFTATVSRENHLLVGLPLLLIGECLLHTTSNPC